VEKKNRLNIKNVIWDWNGTLINDVEISMSTINEALSKGGLQTISEDYYRNHFTFPVRDFYAQLGLKFNGQGFNRYSAAFMETYLQKSKSASLQKGAEESLKFFREKDVRQYILSAMEQSMLEGMLRDFGIIGYFDRVRGLENMHANSKADAGQKLMQETRTIKGNTVIIGDTLHDFEVAGALGVSCFLLSCGHHAHSRLESAKVPVFGNHYDLLKYIQQKKLILNV